MTSQQRNLPAGKAGGRQVKTTVVQASQADKKPFDWGWTAWSISGDAGNSQSMMFGKVVIKAHLANGSHRHVNCDEILYLIAGQLEHYADDIEPVAMEPGDVIFIPAGVAHHARCTSDADAEMIVVYSSPKRQIESA